MRLPPSPRGNEVVLDGLVENLKMPHDEDVGGGLDEALLLPTTPTRSPTNGGGERGSKEGIGPLGNSDSNPKSSGNTQDKKKVVKVEKKDMEEEKVPSLDHVVFLVSVY